MKKVLCLLGIFAMIFSLCGCEDNVKIISIEQSSKNFKYYQEKIAFIAEKYNAVVVEEKDENIKDQRRYKSLILTINESDEIKIWIINTAEVIDGKEYIGREEVSLKYMMNNEKGFNVPLFVELVNSVSGREITEDYCQDFLDAPENKYPSSNYNSDKSDGELIAKTRALNFDEDWMIYYILSEDHEETLSFWGLTKQLED